MIDQIAMQVNNENSMSLGIDLEESEKGLTDKNKKE